MTVSQTTIATRVDHACQQVTEELLQNRNAMGHWTGRLSSSALATATAISALSQYRDHSVWPIVERSRIDDLIEKGSRWLLKHQNQDGGWGDTDESHSNVATSMLAVAALTLAGKIERPEFHQSVQHANDYIDRLGRVSALRKRYGKDKTFAVPILANCAIAGLVPWKDVSALPFEAVVLPQRFYRFVNLPVVSYAVPALVAIGQLKFVKDPPWNPVVRMTRRFSLKRGLDVLTKMQPASGGFLEAIPLTCFVAMSLAHSGRADHKVVQQCIDFVFESFRDEGETGTWPIDTNLATWTTTLAINALSSGSGEDSHLTPELLDWLLSCQYQTVHPFTGADPGGWGWSDLSGAVPDADDTPGALLALRKWFDSPRMGAEQRTRLLKSAKAGIDWLLDLQNRDKGWPTFCRGWGRLPFDRSGNDITAHVIRALIAWRNDIDDPRIATAIESGFGYLRSNAQPDGSWLPLWFGNQDHPDEENPVYGTVKVLLAWLESERMNDSVARKSVEWLLANQNPDSGWGGGPSNQSFSDSDSGESGSIISSLQETALALEILTRLLETPEFADNQHIQTAVRDGAEWMLEAIDAGKTSEKWPIGFYFAKLWYYESLYPLVFCTSTMNCLNRHFGGPPAEMRDQNATVS